MFFCYSCYSSSPFSGSVKDIFKLPFLIRNSSINAFSLILLFKVTKYFNSKDVTQLSGLTEQELTNILQNNKAYNGKAKMYAKYAKSLIAAEKNHGVNAFYLIGVYSLESGWLGSTLTKECNNIGGVKFYSSKPYGNGKMTYQCRGQWAGFDSIDGFIDYHASLLERAYLTPGASHYYGTSVADVAKDYGHSSGVNSIIQIAVKVSSEY